MDWQFVRYGTVSLQALDQTLAGDVAIESTLSAVVVGREPLLLSLVREFLRVRGFTVHPCQGPAEFSELCSHLPVPSGVVVFVDRGNPLGSLGELQRVLEVAHPSPVVVVAPQVNAGAIHAVLRLGAMAIIGGGSDAEELLRGIQMAAKRKIYLDPELVEVAVHTLRASPQKPIAGENNRILSRREEEIVSLLCDGLVAKDVARHLHLSVKTVENHKYNIYRKCGVSSPTELLRYAIAHSLASL